MRLMGHPDFYLSILGGVFALGKVCCQLRATFWTLLIGLEGFFPLLRGGGRLGRSRYDFFFASSKVLGMLGRSLRVLGRAA